MKQLQGKYTNAIVYTDLVEQEALDQIKLLCDQPIAAGSKFCPSCGAKQEEKPAGGFCPHCGGKVEAGSKFCPSCGNKLA